MRACLFTESEQIMRLSTKGRSAVCAMVDVALREQLGPVSLAAVGVRQQISLSYLEHMFSKLRRQGLVKSTRGQGGSYGLGRAASAISMADIIDAVESKRLDASTDQHQQGALAMPDMTVSQQGFDSSNWQLGKCFVSWRKNCKWACAFKRWD